MGATVEAIQVSQYPESATHRGVVCIFCGLPTPVQESREGAVRTTQIPRANRRTSIVRCEVCGKEALYRSYEIVEFRSGP
jgi:hypothetical protein